MKDLAGVSILIVMPSIPVRGMERANLRLFKMMRERAADILFVTKRTYRSKVQREVERIGRSWTAALFVGSIQAYTLGIGRHVSRGCVVAALDASGIGYGAFDEARNTKEENGWLRVANH